MAIPEDDARAAVETRGARPLICDECTIQIGEEYEERFPFEFVDDQGPRPRVMTVCWRCWESLNRRKAKRLAHGH
jgi:hypothetical protein